MLKEFTDWLVKLITEGFKAAWDFVTDALISFFGMVVDAFVALVSTIPVPGFMSGGLGTIWGGLDPGILYILSACGIPAALGIIGAGYAFRLTRKLLTLFQW